jgi:hypothetical protein
MMLAFSFVVKTVHTSLAAISNLYSLLQTERAALIDPNAMAVSVVRSTPQH